jgi:hypothetical protein
VDNNNKFDMSFVIVSNDNFDVSNLNGFIFVFTCTVLPCATNTDQEGQGV